MRHQARDGPPVVVWIVVVWNLVLAGAYYGAAQLGFFFAIEHDSVSPLWPPSGLAISALIIGGMRLAPGVALGAFLANYTTEIAVGAALCIGAGNTLEAVLGALIFRSVEPFRFLRPFAPLSAWLLAATVSAVPSAVIGLGALVVSGDAPVGGAPRLAFLWWVGDSIGTLVVGPAILTARRLLAGGGLRVAPRHMVWLAFFLATVAAVFYVILRVDLGAGTIFLLFPLLLAAAVLFGSSGVYLAGFLCVGFCAWVVQVEGAPFSIERLGQNIGALAPFLFSVALTSHFLAILRRERCVWLPGAVLLVGWAFGGWVFSALEGERRNVERERFADAVEETEKAVKQRMQTYVDTLRGGAGLFMASNEVSRQEWRRYVEALGLFERYEGIQGMGVIFPVQHDSLGRFVEAVRADGAPGFFVKEVPNVERPNRDPGGVDKMIITYVEPESSNAKAIGLNVASEALRLEAARYARDYDQARITRRVTLIQDDRSRPGFLLYVPFFDPSLPRDTVHRRRTALRGWIYAPFLVPAFLEGVLSTRSRQTELFFYEGTQANPDRLIFQTTPDVPLRFEMETVIQLGGERFTCGWSKGPEFIPVRGDPFLGVATLAMLPLLLSGLVLTLRTNARRAEEMVADRTRQLTNLTEDLQVEVREREAAERSAKAARDAAERQREDADRANAAKSDFLAMMSHEIRTPLNGVLGFAELLAEADLPGDYRSWALNIENSGKTLLAIINDILDFSKIEAGKLELHLEPISVLSCAKEVLELIKTRAAEKGLALELEVPVALPASVSADPVRLRQILLNLVSNAIKFTERGEVRVKLEWSPGIAGRGNLFVAVSDTGPGIAAEKRAKLFEKFSQLDGSTTRRYGGTGLGLAICKRLVELMDGEIDLVSEPGKGTTFFFRLPLRVAEEPPEAAGPDADRDANRQRRKVRVLVAEDVPVNQMLAAAVLGRLGCSVEVVDNGRAAVDRAAGEAFDVIFMDCQMPELDGFEATRRIREASGRSSEVPIVALTANAFAEGREACFDAGMNAYLAKPFSRSDVVAVLRDLGLFGETAAAMPRDGNGQL